MKILAVRGENLASLRRFEVDFTGDILGKTGIFAISGPTGAGKSTLLDAICLALYNQTPRIKGSNKVKIGEFSDERDLRIPANDPRTILRRGAVEAFAEVDFSCSKGSWRARWSVYRARRKVDGNLQDSKIQLFNLTTGQDESSHHPKGALERIETLIGLDFDQFCRTILLAQGEFAQFLKAEGDKRAVLLEKMTGTELYAELSKEAYVRAKAEADALEAVKKEAGNLDVLTDADRRALETERDDLAERLKTLATAASEAAAAAAWHETRDRLERSVAEAEDAVKEASDTLAAAAPLRAEIAAVEAGLMLRAGLAARDDAAKLRIAAETRRAEAGERLSLATAANTEAEQSLEAAAAALHSAETDRDARAPEIAAARTLDVRIAEALSAATEAETQAAKLREDARTRTEAAEALRTKYEAQQEKFDQIDRWLAENESLRGLAQQWPYWEQELEAFARAGRDLAKSTAEQAGLEEKLSAARATEADVAARLADAEVVKQKAADGMEQARAALERFDTENPDERLRTERGAIADRLETVLKMMHLARDAMRLMEERDRETTRAETEDREASRCGNHAFVVEGQRILIQEKIEASRRDVKRVEAMEELAARRPDLLISGKPCPLCGSHQHPYAGLPTEAGHVLERLRFELADQERHFADLQREAATAHADAGKHAELAAHARQRLADLLPKITFLEGEWTAFHRRLGEPEGRIPAAVHDPAATASLLALQAGYSARQTELENLERDRKTLLQSLDVCRRNFDATVREIEGFGTDLAAVRDERQALERKLDAVTNKITVTRETLDRIATALADPLSRHGEWQKALTTQPTGFIAARKAEVGRWEEQNRGRSEISTALSDLTNELAVAKESARAADRALTEQVSIVTDRAARLTELRKDRATLLDGRESDAFAAALDRAVKSAKEAHDAARTRAVEAGRELTAAREAESLAREAVAEASNQAEAKADALDRELAAAGIPSIDELRRRLALGEDWLAAKRRDLQALETAVTAADATFKDRADAFSRHCATDAPTLDREAARRQRETVEAEKDEAAKRIGAIDNQLAADAALREKKAALVADLERRAAVAKRWEVIRELIGSADGKKFRVFAQSLTLDALLDFANHHLRELRPRYRLERVPGYDMELQVVDREMGDEIRGCQTLSGGETFLTSLALALGLSSLSSRNVNVESLFIDEGFGTLDRDTLETAISVLDQLQATGRQVGIISHIPDLSERIGFQVRVTPRGAGTSEVTVTGGI